MFSVFFYLLLGLFIFVSVMLIMVVLIQKGRGGGLASAFGGASGHTPFGAKTGDVLTWITSVVFGVFVLLGVVLNLMANKLDDDARKAMEARTGSAQTTQDQGK